MVAGDPIPWMEVVSANSHLNIRIQNSSLRIRGETMLLGKDAGRTLWRLAGWCGRQLGRNEGFSSDIAHEVLRSLH